MARGGACNGALAGVGVMVEPVRCSVNKRALEGVQSARVRAVRCTSRRSADASQEACCCSPGVRRPSKEVACAHAAGSSDSRTRRGPWTRYG